MLNKLIPVSMQSATQVTNINQGIGYQAHSYLLPAKSITTLWPVQNYKLLAYVMMVINILRVVT